MPSSATPAPSLVSARTWWVVALALLVAGAALVVRVPAIAEPLGIDQSLWASAVRGMSHGLALYRDVWDRDRTDRDSVQTFAETHHSEIRAVVNRR